MLVGPLKIKLQLMCGDIIAIGPGKADVIEAITREGSISAAARALGMSYRRTWLLVDEMNRCFADRLIDTLSGGGRERGARVTDAGHAVLAAYRTIERSVETAADGAPMAALAQLLRDRPAIAGAMPA